MPALPPGPGRLWARPFSSLGLVMVSGWSSGTQGYWLGRGQRGEGYKLSGPEHMLLVVV